MITIKEEACKACSLCVNVCPKKIISLGSKMNQKGYNYAVVDNDSCISCAFCAKICPDSVIEVYK
jgi:2-oxoglutarate ferredoxin oxidoreductase subunit delta